MPKFLTDLVERTAATYALTALGLLTADGFAITNLGADKAALVAAIPAGLTVVKGFIARFVGDPNTAALLPTPPVIRR